MPETNIYFWTDRDEHAYVTLRERGGHWNVEWGHRDPPGSDHYVELGEHTTSVRDEAVREMVNRVRLLSEEPDEAMKLERRLREALDSARRKA